MSPSRSLVFSIASLALTVATAFPARADTPAAQAPLETRQLDTVEVVAQVPGPGLWEVRHGEHVLWILGTQSPLPRRFEWIPNEVQRRLDESSVLIAPPAVTLAADIGTFRALTLLPSLMRARRNPEQRGLAEVVGPELYARWLPLKQRYLGRNRKVETWRPLFAAMKLWEEAIEDARMTGSGPIWKTVAKAARKRDIEVLRPTVEVSIADPKASIRSFAADTLDDHECFRRTLERLETDIEAMRERAEAWAVGDLESLRALPFSDQNAACREALMSDSMAQSEALRDLPERVRASWLQSVDTVLAEHRSGVAVLPIAELLDPQSTVLRELRARGYSVTEPGAVDQATALQADPALEAPAAALLAPAAAATTTR